jgi:YHS domain-containing protein
MRLVAILIAFAVGSPLLLTGCATAPAAPPSQATGGQQHAECTVCKHNADLACIDVVVEKDTPRTGYDGKTFYFCSDQCRKKFEKEPAKYAKE